MQPRSEPLLWLQCLALGAIPLELLLIRLVLAGADPGPVPGVERFLIWGVGVLAPAVALWRRPADWGSLLFVRQPLASRNSDQLRISASHGGLSSRAAVVIAAVILLPVLWWMDDLAVLASEFSPVSGQSRLVTLLLVSPLLALMVWQVQQLIQAAALLLGSPATVAPADSAFRAEPVATQRTSLGLQLLNLPALEWPESAVEPIKQEPDKAIEVEDTELETDESAAVHPVTAAVSEEADPETAPESVVAGAQAEDIDPTSDQDSDEAIGVGDTSPEPYNSTADVRAADISSDNEEPDKQERDGERLAINTATAKDSDEAQPEALEPVDAEDQEDMSEDDDSEDISAVNANESSVAAAAVPVAIEPEQPGEEQESNPLDAEVSQIDGVAGGSTESHREQAESCGGKESEPDEPSEPTPGGL